MLCVFCSLKKKINGVVFSRSLYGDSELFLKQATEIFSPAVKEACCTILTKTSFKMHIVASF